MGRIARGAGPNGFENRIRGKDGADRRLQWKAMVSPRRQLIWVAARGTVLTAIRAALDSET
jgi:hypothetical protein